MSDNKPKRLQSRHWQIIAPDEWSNLGEIKSRIKSISRNYYFVRHDLDVDELTRELKKPHWHYLFTFGSSRDLSTMENYFKDFENLVSNSYEKINSITWAKRYLVHADDPQKAQYSISSVETNDPLYSELFIPSLGKIEEMQHVVKYMVDVLDTDKQLTFTELLKHYEGQLVKLNFQSKMSLIMRMRDYFERYHIHDVDSSAKAYDESYTPVEDPRYKVNLDNSPLPF